MRTLKKTLCMVLVLSMMLGLCAIGTSAAPAETINYKEAVAVMKALNVMVGDANGFRPQAGLKRSEACRIVVALMGDDDIAVSTASGFSDVPETEWYAKYVAYCASKGYVGGVGDGRFAPDSPLTGYAWALILLRVLGYDPAEEDIGGDDWTLDVATFIKRNQINLGNGIDGFGLGAINREEAAQCAFQALNKGMVRYTGGSTVTIGGVPVVSGKTLVELENADGSDYTLAQSLGMKKEADSADDAGRPATVYSLNGKTVATIVQDAAYTTTTAMTTAALNKALKSAKVLGTGDTDYTDETNPTANGVVVEWFDADTAIVTNTRLAVVTNVRNVAETKAHGAYTEYTYKIGDGKATSGRVYSSVVNKDTDNDSVIISGNVAKGDTVLVTAASGELDTLKVASTVTGALTAVRNNTLTVGGKVYTLSGTAGTTVVPAEQSPNADKSVAYYVDNYGYIMAPVTAAETEVPAVYGMLLSVDNSWTLSNGKLVESWSAKAAGEDGKVADYAITETEYNELSKLTLPAVATIEDELDEDGAKVGTDFAKVNTTAAAFKASDKTVDGKLVSTDTLFVYVAKDSKGNITGVNTLNSAKAKSFAENKAHVVADAAGRVAKTVFVTEGGVDATVSDSFVYYLGTYEKTVGNAFKIDVILKGEQTTMTVKALPAGGAGFYGSIDSTGATTKATAIGKKLENVIGYVYIDDNYKADLTAASSTPVYVIDVTGSDVTAAATLTFGAIDSIGDANDEIYAAVSNGTVLAFYVLQDAAE